MTATDPVPGWFQASWPRLGLAAGVAALFFFAPRGAPLEWYPLNEPGMDINYLEISCAANVTGTVEIRYDLARNGHRPIDTISWPISATARTYTYTFPLPDAPMVALHVSPPAGGELVIRQMRIINRRNEEIRRFPRDLFRAEHDLAAIAAVPEGWKLVADGPAPSARLELFSPVVPAGMDHRNLLRCLQSTGYLALMLWLLLAAMAFAFHRPRSWRDAATHLGFMGWMALMFALVGNRGLIRNSIDYARYVPPRIPAGLTLEFDAVSSGPSQAQVFWDTGAGFNEAESNRQRLAPTAALQMLRFPLPAAPAPWRALRFDPRDDAGRVEIRGIRLVDPARCLCIALPLDSLQPERDIATLDKREDGLVIQTVQGATDPITRFTPGALELVNRIRAGDQP